MKKVELALGGIHCSSCIASIEKVLNRTDGITKVSSSLQSASATVEYDPQKIEVEKIISKINSLGYTARETSADNMDSSNLLKDAIIELKDIKLRLIVSLILTIPTALIAMILMPMPPSVLVYLELILSAVVLFWGGRKILVSGLSALKNSTFDMNVLVAVGTLSAFIYSLFATFFHNLFMENGIMTHVYFESTAVIITLIMLGKFLEARAKIHTSDAIRKLMDLQPKTARIIKDGIETQINTDEVAMGDIIIVRPGERVPVDGIVVSGESEIDESMISGESVPIEKSTGSLVTGGTINGTGSFNFEAKKVGSQTVIAQIVRMVKEAQATKAPIQRTADMVASYFVPVVIGVAFVTLILWLIFGRTHNIGLGFQSFVSVLIIACPCALGLATPTAVAVGSGRGALAGILIKSSEILEKSGKINTVVFDKTGTITTGVLQVTDIVSTEPDKENEVLKIAAAAESFSEHPISKAIVSAAKEAELTFDGAYGFRAFAGGGIAAFYDDVKLLIGSEKLMEENSMDVSQLSDKATDLRKQGKTQIYVSSNKSIIGIIALADTPKPSSKEAVEKLIKMGIEVVMITGDNNQTAQAVGNQVGITNIYAQTKPDQKADAINKLKSEGKIVAMVGDGINDAPALAAADVGIAMGSGTDIAMESADITLVSGNIEGVVQAIILSRATLANIKQNLFFAFIYNILGIPIAAGILYPFFGILLNPMIASAAMAASSLSVVSNALRLKKMKL